MITFSRPGAETDESRLTAVILPAEAATVHDKWRKCHHATDRLDLVREPSDSPLRVNRSKSANTVSVDCTPPYYGKSVTRKAKIGAVVSPNGPRCRGTLPTSRRRVPYTSRALRGNWARCLNDPPVVTSAWRSEQRSDRSKTDEGVLFGCALIDMRFHPRSRGTF